MGPYTSDPTDHQLLARIRAGDPAALSTILGRYWVPLLRYTSTFIGVVDDAEDIAQETFIRLWRRRTTWTPEGSVRGLLFRIARNVGLDERRAPQPRPTPAGAEDVETAALRARVAQAVNALPAQRREVFRLVREHELSHREVAQVLGLASQTVANHMSLALADLRAALTPLRDGSPDDLPGPGPEAHESTD